jgi:hypothetical protein
LPAGNIVTHFFKEDGFMAGENLVSLELTDEEIREYEAAIESLKKLSVKLIEISPADRMEAPKMGKKTFQFVTKTIDVMDLTPDLVPKYVNPVEVKKDVKLIAQLQKILFPLQSITRRVEDTTMVAGSEAYLGCISMYQSLKTAARSNVESARTHYNNLREYFPGSGTRSKTDTTAAP